MSYEPDGYLTTDEKSPGDGGDTLTWSTETDWDNAQDSEDVEIIGGSFQLAEALTIIDGFEDGDISEYEGDKSRCTVQTGTVYDGTYALEMDTTGDPTRIGSNDGGGLNHYPERGDVIRYHTWRDDTHTVNMFNVGPSDAEVSTALSDGYICRIGEGDFRIGKRTNGGTTWLTESTYDETKTGEWLTHEFDFDSAGDGDLTYTLWDSNDNELGSVTANDTEYDGSNLQIRTDGTGGQSSTAYWDYIRVV